MKSHRYPRSRPAPRLAFAGYRFPPEVITLAVRWYLRFGLSYRDVEELLAERGIEVDHVTIYRWVQRFAPEFVEAARARQHMVGDRWHVDETYLNVGGTRRDLFRAIAQFGQVIDVFLSPRRNREAARRLFVRAISRTRVSPTEVTIDRNRVYPRVLGEFLPAAFHRTEAHANDPLEGFRTSAGAKSWAVSSTSIASRPELPYPTGQLPLSHRRQIGSMSPGSRTRSRTNGRLAAPRAFRVRYSARGGGRGPPPGGRSGWWLIPGLNATCS
jgi:IS6 family transposase